MERLVCQPVAYNCAWIHSPLRHRRLLQLNDRGGIPEHGGGQGRPERLCLGDAGKERDRNQRHLPRVCEAELAEGCLWKSQRWGS